MPWPLIFAAISPVLQKLFAMVWEMRKGTLKTEDIDWDTLKVKLPNEKLLERGVSQEDIDTILGS